MVRCDEFFYSRMPSYFDLLDVVICLIYLLNYILMIFIQPSRYAYFMSKKSLMEIIIIIPPLVYSYDCDQLGLFLKACSRMLRIYKIQAFLRSSQHDQNDSDKNVDLQIKLMITELLLVFFTSTVLWQVLENFNTENSNYPYGFLLSFYYLMATMTTVGYGDYSPTTWQGQMFIICVIVYTITIMIPVHTQELLHLMGLKSFYARIEYTHNSEIPHLIITGKVCIQALDIFCKELYHPEHGSGDRHAVILQPFDPSQEMLKFLNNHKYENSVYYYNGNPIRNQSFERIKVVHAKYCILLTNKNSKNAIGDDHQNILKALALKKYIYEQTKNSKMPFCMQLIKPESKKHFYASLSVPSTSDQIIIVEEIKMNLMSKSCFAPGIINFVSNLITSSADQGEMDQVWL